MANKNITVAGADYTDVPGVELPVTGGGTAYFAEVSDTTATASDVASGTYFYNSAGVRTAGTASGGGAQNTWYGTSSTGAGTQTKVVDTTTGDFTLATGNMVRVKFTNAQTYNGGITLNVDGTGAKSAMRNGTTATTRYFYLAGEVVDFVYDGTYFVAVNEGIATTTYYGVTKLTNSATSTSTSTSATPNAVKIAYDLADSKSVVSVSQTLTSGTEIGSVTVDGTATTLYAPSGGDIVTVQQTLASGTEIGGVTVNGTQTKLYAPSGGSTEALTDAEIEEAVEEANIVYNISITTNGEAYAYDYAGNKITSAKAGETCYVKGVTTITDISSTPSVTFTYESYHVWYSFIMPMSDLAIIVTTESGGGSND